MEDKEPSLLTPLGIAFLLALAFICVSGWDFEDELIRDAMRKDPPKVLGYSIKQDSPGLDKGEPMFPLHSPVSPDDIRAGKRRSTKEIR